MTPTRYTRLGAAAAVADGPLLDWDAGGRGAAAGAVLGAGLRLVFGRGFPLGRSVLESAAIGAVGLGAILLLGPMLTGTTAG